MAEREWREASDERPSTIVLALILLSGGLLRFWSLGHGIPYAIGVDEPQIMDRVVHMMKTGDLNPHFFDYPGLYIYLQLGVACLKFLLGATGGMWTSLDQVDASSFLVWARGLTAIFGTATILVVYRLALRWGARHALLAAGLLAVLPMHVRESHYALTDVPMTFFVALTFLAALAAHDQPTTRTFFIAGAIAGLATATKYNGGLALLLPLIAAFSTKPGTPRLRLALVSVGGLLVAFAVAAPYTFLDLPGFLNGYAKLASSFQPGRGADAPWELYLKHLRLNFQWPGMLMIAAGLILGVVRAVKGPGQLRWTLLIVFPCLYFYFISRQSLVFGRYLLPIVPFLCILAAIAVISGVSVLRRFEIPRMPRTVLIAGLTIAAILPPAVTSIRFVRDISRPSTQAVAYDWIRKNIPTGSRIIIENFNLRLPGPRYTVDHVIRLIDRDLDEYLKQGWQYAIGSSQSFGPVIENPHLNPATYAQYMKLFEQSTELAKIEPSDTRPGPRLWIYKLGR